MTPIPFDKLLNYSSVDDDFSFHTFSYYTHILEFVCVCVSGSANCGINSVKQQTGRLPTSMQTGQAKTLPGKKKTKPITYLVRDAGRRMWLYYS